MADITYDWNERQDREVRRTAEAERVERFSEVPTTANAEQPNRQGADSMKLDFTIYYEDGTSGIVSFEKPPGAHPESAITAQACLVEAQKTGKKVKSMARTVAFHGHLVDMPIGCESNQKEGDS